MAPWKLKRPADLSYAHGDVEQARPPEAECAGCASLKPGPRQTVRSVGTEASAGRGCHARGPLLSAQVPEASDIAINQNDIAYDPTNAFERRPAS